MAWRSGSHLYLLASLPVIAVLLAWAGFALQLDSADLTISGEKKHAKFRDKPPGEFEYVFTRLAHYSPRARSSRGHTWNTDYPKADRQFLQGVLRLTHIEAREQEQVLRPMDPNLFAFPFLYAVEVGYWRFTDEEAARLREYLLRGGFLIVDDFHGSRGVG